MGSLVLFTICFHGIYLELYEKYLLSFIYNKLCLVHFGFMSQGAIRSTDRTTNKLKVEPFNLRKVLLGQTPVAVMGI